MFLASEFRYVTKRIGLWCNAYGDITDFENWISQKHKILDISRTKRYFFFLKKKKKEKKKEKKKALITHQGLPYGKKWFYSRSNL